MRRPVQLAAAFAALLALSACQPTKPKVNVIDRPPATGGGKSAALRAMEPVAIAAHRCWIASKDPAFRAYRFANELSSYSGNPRFLLVPAKNYGGLPALVVEARAGSSRVDAFGPLLNGKHGARIQADVARWSSGDSSCGSRA